MRAVPLIEAVPERAFGSKAVKLGEALRAGLPVPPGFALDAAIVDAAASGAEEAQDAVAAAFEALGGTVAVRSSAVGEDSSQASFAGQHLTVLNVTSAEQAIAAVKRVRDSAFEPSARAYRRRRGVSGRPRMGIVIQRLVEPEAAGVLFTRNPLDGSDERVIEATFGLGEAVVSGLVTPDSFRLDRDGRLLEATLGDKPVALRSDGAGGVREETLDPAAAAEASLGAADLGLLHQLAVRCEALYGNDLDLEWAVAEGSVWLLQARPITTLASRQVA